MAKLVLNVVYHWKSIIQGAEKAILGIFCIYS